MKTSVWRRLNAVARIKEVGHGRNGHRGVEERWRGGTRDHGRRKEQEGDAKPREQFCSTHDADVAWW